MNLVEKLLAVDKEEFDKIEKKEIVSRQLSRLTGEEDTKIIIQAIDGDLFGSLSGSGLHNNGDVDYEKLFSANAKIAAAGIVEPNEHGYKRKSAENAERNPQPKHYRASATILKMGLPCSLNRFSCSVSTSPSTGLAAKSSQVSKILNPASL